jgi:A/G-specific adenine glycosylase
LLAAASPADVLRAWRGMGYDRRALNLHRAARIILAEHGGDVPRDIDALERLPGIGPYTARAVASIAFGARVGAVDTNVRRVLSRSLMGAVGLGPRDLQRAADRSVDPDRAGEWTHALMDLGATICRPAQPRCDACPLRAWCRFAAAKAGFTTEGRPSTERRRRGQSTTATSFTATTRWLRARILDRLREAVDGSWTDLDAPIGGHDMTAVEAALRALSRDQLIEVDPVDPRRARLTTA